MAEALSEVVLWLFIINVGTAFGAGIYEAKIVIPQWTIIPAGAEFQWNAAAARHTDPGVKFWVFLTTVPLTLLTVASLVAAWHSAPGPRSALWFGAAVVVLVERIATFAYFIPTMGRLQRETVRSPAVATRVARWVSFNYVRNGIYLAAWITALKALAFTR